MKYRAAIINRGRPLRLMVRTSAFQAENMGSNPVGVNCVADSYHKGRTMKIFKRKSDNKLYNIYEYKPAGTKCLGTKYVAVPYGWEGDSVDLCNATGKQSWEDFVCVGVTDKVGETL